MTTVRGALSSVLSIGGVLMSAWGAAIAGALLGLVVGGAMGPLLASVDVSLILDKAGEHFGIDPGLLSWLGGLVRWLPGFGLAVAIVSLLTGWLAGMGLGAVIGSLVGVVVVLVSSTRLGARKVLASASSSVTNTRLDFFFRRRLSGWLEDVSLRNVVGLGLGVVAAVAARWWSASLPFDHVGPEYMVALVFGVVTVSMIGGTIGYSVASLCLALQRHAPWALAGTAPGVLVARALGADDVVPFYSWALIGALVGHVLSLVIGPLRGRLSWAREGALLGLLIGWFLLDSPTFAFFSAIGCLVLGRVLGSPARVEGAATSEPALGVALARAPLLSAPWWSYALSFRSWFGAFIGFVFGGFFGYPGGLLPWLFAGGCLLHLGPIRTRWVEAGAQANAVAGGAAPAAVGVVSAGGAAGAMGGLATAFGAVFGFACLGLATLAGLSSLGEGPERSAASLFGLAPAAYAAANDSSPAVAPKANDSAKPLPSPAATTALPAPVSAAGSNAPSAAPSAVNDAAPTPTSNALPPEAAAVSSLLESYYADLNASTFDANRYFEPNVERYITMVGTTTSAMNAYIQNVFPKQFKQHHFGVEPGSLEREGPGQYIFVEKSSYFLVAKKKHLDQRVQVRVRLGAGGKLTFLHQFKRLPAQSPAAAPSAAKLIGSL
jgi:hypothetical protein